MHRLDKHTGHKVAPQFLPVLTPEAIEEAGVQEKKKKWQRITTGKSVHVICKRIN